jgi:hypothetical protein
VLYGWSVRTPLWCENPAAESIRTHEEEPAAGGLMAPEVKPAREVGEIVGQHRAVGA